ASLSAVPTSASAINVVFQVPKGTVSYTLSKATGNLAPQEVKSWTAVTNPNPSGTPISGLPADSIYSFKLVWKASANSAAQTLVIQAKTMSDSAVWGKLTGNQLSTISHENSGNVALDTLQTYADALNNSFASNKITSLADKAAFLGQATQETVHLSALKESG